MLTYVEGVVSLVALYWLPGWLFLRRAELDLVSRVVIAAGITYPVTTAGVVALGGFEVINQLTLALLLLVLLLAAYVVPLRGSSFYRD